ncbi:MAG: hypothetical protein IT521_01070 [Burkholderiales bacterium]|nr:hypothetical protein [Burkholderiales bacterium]
MVTTSACNGVCCRLLKALALALALIAVSGVAQADVPKELYDALKVDASASPKGLHDALIKRYKDPAQGAGPGALWKYWEPIEFSKYFDPASFYKPPTTVKVVATREECVGCHSSYTAGWVRMWKSSAHANLDKIRKLTPKDPTYYKKTKLEEVETNLRSLGKLGTSEALKEVGCIDCHIDVNTKKAADHSTELRMPTADVCATCHLQEFAERESERDTASWPNDEYPKGRPSHALDYKSVVETSIWAGMAQREIAEGCTACHYNQNKCDGCHTRHSFSVVEARKPEACSLCHSGIDHPNFEAYMGSKHGTQYATLGSTWNWNVQLKDAFTKGGQTAPTCQTCHFEYQGQYGHNLVRKVRWANYPMLPGIAEGIKSERSAHRLQAWVQTCSNCHSGRFASAYLDLMDKGTLAGVVKGNEALAVVKKLYDDKLMPGQLTNRPAPPPTDKDGPAQFFQLFWSKGNNPSMMDLYGLDLVENVTSKLHVNLAHVNPGGWAYTQGWEQLNRNYTEIMDEDTKMREMAALKDRVAKLEPKRTSLLNLDSTHRASLGGLGGVLLLGGATLIGWRRRWKKSDR